MSEIVSGSFQHVIGDAGVDPKGVKKVLMSSGKVYYDLLNEREKLGREDVALLRLEQLYPLRDDVIRAALEPYGKGAPVVWVQEEPINNGAWYHLLVRYGASMHGRPFSTVARPEAASPATGSGAAHEIEQADLLKRAFEG